MIDLIQQRRSQIEALCRRFQVRRLEVFGSTAEAGRFDPARSDGDFLVEFEPGVELGPWLTRYFDLRDDELARLLGGAVDLVMISALRNPYFIREVNRTR